MKKYFLPLILIFLLMPIESFSGVKLLEKCTTYPDIESISVGKNNRIFIGTRHYIYYSDDGGKTWNIIKDKYPGYFMNSTANLYNDSYGNLYVKDRNNYDFVAVGTDVLTPNKERVSTIASNQSMEFPKLIFGKIAMTNMNNICYLLDKGGKMVFIDSSLHNSFKTDDKQNWGYHPALGVFKGIRNPINNNGPYFYRTIDTGKTWYRFNTLPNNPQKFNTFKMIDNNYFSVLVGSNWYIYDMLNGAYRLNNNNNGEFIAFCDNLFKLDNMKIYMSDDRGASFNKIIDSNVKCMALDSLGNLFYFNNNFLYKYNTTTGEKIELDLSKIGCTFSREFSRRGDYFYYLNGKGRYKFLKDSLRLLEGPGTFSLDNFDFNDKNEILYDKYDEKHVVHYSSNGGETWSLKKPENSDNVLYGNGKVKFLADGTIYANQNMFYPLKSGEIIQAIKDTVFFLNKKNEILKKHVINSSESIYDFYLMGDGEVYWMTSEGIYWVDSKTRNFEKISDELIYSLTKDDSGNLFGIKIHPENLGIHSSIVKYNKEDKKWYIYDIGPGTVEYTSVVAYADSKLIFANDYFYTQDLKNEKFLIAVNLNLTNQKEKKNRIKVVDQDYQPVADASVGIYDLYNDKIDIIKTDTQGEAEYNINENLKSNLLFTFSAIASKKDYLSSAPCLFYLNNLPDTNFLKVEINKYRDTVYNSLDSFKAAYKIYYNKKEAFQTQICFHNLLTGKYDTSDNINRDAEYKFLIPKDTKQGIYTIDIFIKNENGEKIYSNKQYFMVDDFREIKDVVENEECTSNSVINFYPNPCVNKVSLQINENDALRKMIIVSLGGKLMYEGEYKKEFDISDFPAGTYYVQIGDKFGKFVKNKE